VSSSAFLRAYFELLLQNKNNGFIQAFSFSRHKNITRYIMAKGKKRRTYSPWRKPGKQNLRKSKKPVGYKKEDEKEKIRLNKLLASAGICSRREADDLIQAGLVSVNGKVVTKLGTKVSIKDDIRYNGQRIKSERPVYILINKPKDYVTTMKDPHASRTVMTMIKDACPERVYPVGRLDRNSTGVLLLTNDGELTRVLTHPSYNKKKIYHVTVDPSLRAGDFKKLLDGIELEDGFIQADALSYTDSGNKRNIGIEIHSGRNRIIRRMFEHLGYKVIKLDRVYFAGLTKKGLPRGHWRFLTEKEIAMLKMGAYE
jgi:23S rRNA pseudouridine2605 synthase